MEETPQEGGLCGGVDEEGTSEIGASPRLPSSRCAEVGAARSPRIPFRVSARRVEVEATAALTAVAAEDGDLSASP